MKKFKDYIETVLIAFFWIIIVNLSDKLFSDSNTDFIKWGGVVLINIRMLLVLYINDRT